MGVIGNTASTYTMTPLDWATIIASVFTAIGVIGTAVQIWLVRGQTVTQFEDSLVGSYRALVRELPVRAMLGSELSEQDQEKYLQIFFCYFDLCNEQVFLRQQGRVSAATWTQWREGILSNIALPAFAQAWQSIKSADGKSFHELRQLEATGLRWDPRVRWFRRALNFLWIM